jgi:hypothetical protein
VAIIGSLDVVFEVSIDNSVVFTFAFSKGANTYVCTEPNLTQIDFNE